MIVEASASSIVFCIVIVTSASSRSFAATA
jgi:hypothetical protein